jgi:hypothetical protein
MEENQRGNFHRIFKFSWSVTTVWSLNLAQNYVNMLWICQGKLIKGTFSTVKNMFHIFGMRMCYQFFINNITYIVPWSAVYPVLDDYELCRYITFETESTMSRNAGGVNLFFKSSYILYVIHVISLGFVLFLCEHTVYTLKQLIIEAGIYSQVWHLIFTQPGSRILEILPHWTVDNPEIYKS